MPTNEASIKKIAGDCSLIIDKPKRAVVTRAQGIEALHNLYSKCSNIAGRLPFPSHPDVFIEVRPRAKDGTQWTAFNPDFEFTKPYCFKPKGTPDLKRDDCLKAYDNLHHDIEGRINWADNAPSQWARTSFGGCQLTISTNDGSMLKMGLKQAYPYYEKLVKTCDKSPGFMNLDAAEGINGRVLKTPFIFPFQYLQ
ncbi:hypothetical protein MJO29_014787 [Puccinia striiformis f. sp. tritici]|nr:hypothetical protein MJO29_014787 [Puccinia striiformis f. sp. tritici]